MSKIQYIVELTYEEALTFALASRSGTRRYESGLAGAIRNVGNALVSADPELERAQFRRWKENGSPDYSKLQDQLPRIDQLGEVIP